MGLSLQQRFGNLDIYLFDQLLRGNITPGMAILDAGCGHGRNLVYLLREGYAVCGVDAKPETIAEVRRLAAALAPLLPPENFRVEAIEAMSFADATFDVVLLNAVLHFAQSDLHFKAMLHGAWRVLKPGGLLFCRLASTIGMEDAHYRIEGRRFLSLKARSATSSTKTSYSPIQKPWAASWSIPSRPPSCRTSAP